MSFMNRLTAHLGALLAALLLTTASAWGRRSTRPGGTATGRNTGAGGACQARLFAVADRFKAEAAKKGIRDATLAQALDGIQPINRILDFDKRQPEFTLTLDQYLSHVLTPQKIADGKKLLHQHYKLLTKIYQRYHVPPQTIVALWGIESGFGKNIGDYPVVPALATLAYDGRRSQYFRTELINALTIVDRGATPQQMRGSWAGAMGQCQFMPSTYLKYAQKWEGEGPGRYLAHPGRYLRLGCQLSGQRRLGSAPDLGAPRQTAGQFRPVDARPCR